jgi:hypothetical protein
MAPKVQVSVAIHNLGAFVDSLSRFRAPVYASGDERSLNVFNEEEARNPRHSTSAFLTFNFIETRGGENYEDTNVF